MLLSGVVRNRKTTGASQLDDLFQFETPVDTVIPPPPPPVSSYSHSQKSTLESIQSCFRSIFAALWKDNLLHRVSLRGHGFSFQWDLLAHCAVCLLSLSVFQFSGHPSIVIAPFFLWLLYHVLFLLAPACGGIKMCTTNSGNIYTQAGGGNISGQPRRFGFRRLKAAAVRWRESVVVALEEFLSPRLLPVLSVCFLAVMTSLAATASILGGPPLCYDTCHVCLSQWSASIPLIPGTPLYESIVLDGNALSESVGCGFANGRELLTYYTMAQTSFLLFTTVVVALAACLAWKMAKEDIIEHRDAVAWLANSSPPAAAIRSRIEKTIGPPGGPIRPEASLAWVLGGILVALSFATINWRQWRYMVSAPPLVAFVIIGLHLLVVVLSMLMLHLGFFGRLVSLYRRNYERVSALTSMLMEIHERDLEMWWNARSFILNDDLSIDYDLGGLAIAASVVATFGVLLVVIVCWYRDDSGGVLSAFMEAPGSYSAYACFYMTCCLLRIFTIATDTFAEQYRHMEALETLSTRLGFKATIGHAIAPVSDHQNTDSIRVNGGLVRSRSHSSNFDVGLGLDEDDSDYGVYIEDHNVLKLSSATTAGLTTTHSFSTNSPVPLYGGQSPFSERKLTMPSFRGASAFSANINGIMSAFHAAHEESNNTIDTPKTIGLSPDPEDAFGEHSWQVDVENRASELTSTPGNNTYESVVENNRASIAELVSQIRLYDPYPCILGVPIMPSLFAHSKVYIFLLFFFTGLRLLIECVRLF